MFLKKMESDRAVMMCWGNGEDQIGHSFGLYRTQVSRVSGASSSSSAVNDKKQSFSLYDPESEIDITEVGANYFKDQDLQLSRFFTSLEPQQGGQKRPIPYEIEIDPRSAGPKKKPRNKEALSPA